MQAGAPARTRTSDRQRWLLAGALATALALRLAFAIGYWPGNPLTHDETEYLHLGLSLAEGNGLRYPADARDVLPHERFGRAPLYPAFIAAIATLDPNRVVRNVRIAQCLVGCVSVWLIGAIAGRAGGSRARLAAVWLAAVYPPLVWLCGFLLSESLYIAVALTTVVVLSRVVDASRPTSIPASRQAATGLLGGALAGLGVLTRPALLFLLPFVVGWGLLHRRWIFAGSIVVAAAIVIAPWTLRNYREYHRFVLVASEGGITFWTGNHPLSPGEGDMAANPRIKLDSRRLRAGHPGLTEEEMESIYYREALAAIRHDPIWWAGLLARKAFYTFVPGGPSYRLHSGLYQAASIVPYVLVLPFGVWGLLRSRHADRWPRALVMLSASAMLVCIVFFPQERFRVPTLDLSLIVGAALLCAPRRPAGANQLV